MVSHRRKACHGATSSGSRRCQGLLIAANDIVLLLDWFAEFGITAAAEIPFDLNHASPVDGCRRTGALQRTALKAMPFDSRHPVAKPSARS
jgi:hypothetical protein